MQALNVEPVYALEENCVSEKVASQMAIEVNKLFLSTYGVGIAGYATAGPESGINDLFAYYAIAVEGKIITSGKITSDKKNTVEAQLDFSAPVISAVGNVLKEQ